MCGRYRITRPFREIVDLYRLSSAALRNDPPRYNIAPSQPIPAVRLNGNGERELGFYHWGLLPPWAKERKEAFRAINARSDGVATRPTFRKAFKSKRALLPVDGWYEWTGDAKARLPWLFTIGADARLVSFAGLWEGPWRDPKSGESIESACLITTEPNAVAAEIHDRMPVVLHERDYDAWLNPETPADRLQSLLVPYEPASEIIVRRVSSDVNSSKFEGEPAFL